jgi:fibronectin-binding autotransporter adhesin
MVKNLFLAFIFLSINLFSNTITSNGTGGGNWSAGGSWLGGIAPVAGDNAIIAGGDVIVISVANTPITNLTVTGSLSFTVTRTLTVSGNLIMNPGSSIDGTATGVVNVTGTFQAVSGGIETIGRLTINVTSTSQIDGALTFINSTGTPTFIGNVTLSATGSINFTTSAQTIAMSGNLIMNPGSLIDGTITGSINVAGTFQAISGGTETIGRVNITVNSTSQIDGTLAFSNGTGVPTLKGNVTLSATGSINFTAVQTVVLSGNLTMNPGSSISGSVTGVINVAGTFTGAAGGTETLGRLTLTITNTSAINGTLLFSSATGTKTFTGDVTVAAAGIINFSAAQTVAMSGNLNATAGSNIGGGGAIGIINVAGNFNPLTGGTTTLGGLTLNITGNLTIPGTAVLNAAAANNSITVGGNWTNTSSAVTPFLAGTNTVTFNGSAGTQVISTTTAAGEPFYNITISNTSVSSPGVQINQNQIIAGALFFTTTATVNISGNITMNASSSIDGSATGVLNATGTFADIAGGTETIGRVAITITSTSQINGTLTFSSATGTETFTGNVTLATTGVISFTAAKTVAMSGNLTMNPGSSISGTSTGIINVTGTFTGAAGGTATLGRVTLTVTNTSAINGTLLFSSATGTKTFTGDVTVGAAGIINFSAVQTLAMGGNLNSTAGASIGGGGAVGIINVAGNFNPLTGGTTTLGGLTLNITGNLTIPGTAKLDASAASNNITVGGNWTNTSSVANPFVPGTNTVTFNGSAGTQVISTTAAAGETFYNITISNTSVASPGVQINQNQTIVGALFFTTPATVNISGNLVMNSGSSIDGSATGVLNISGTFADVASGTESIGRVTITVTSTSQIAGTLTFSSATGIATLTGNTTLATTGAIYFTGGKTVTMGNLTMNPGSSIDGSSTGIINVGGTLSAVAGGAESIGKVTITVTSTSQINGALTFFVNAGLKTLTGNVTVSTTGSIYFSVGATTATILGNLTMNPGSSVDASASGVLNIGGTFQAVSGGIETIGAVTFSVTSTSQIDGTLTVTNTTGTKTFTGNVTLSATGSINFTAAETLAMSGNLTMNAGSSIDGSATGIINATGTFTSVAGGTETLGRVTLTVTNTSAINGTLLFSNATGVKTFTGDVTVGAAGVINFSVVQTIAMGGSLNSTAGANIGGGGAIGIINVAGNFNALTGGTSTLGGLTLNITGNLTIQGTGVLNASAANNNITVGGNWTDGSSAATPFLDGTNTVTFNGSAGTQVISSIVAGGEIFYNITISNTSGSNPGVQMNQNLTLSAAMFYTTTATVSLSGNLIMNAGSSIDGSSAGVLNVSGTFQAVSGGAETIGGISLSVTGTSQIDGTLTITNTAGTKTLTGNVTLSATGSISFTAAETIAMSGNLIMNPGSSIDGSGVTGFINITGTFTGVTGGTETIGRLNITVTNTSAINGTLLFSNATGAKTFIGNVTVAAAGVINFSVAGTIAMSGNLNSTAGAIIGGGGAIGVINVAGNFNALTGGTSTLNGLTLNITGNLTIQGTGVLSASAANNSITLRGNWTVTSSAADPFVEGTTSSITLNGTAGTQSISTVLAAGETFNNLIFNNTSATTPGVQIQQNITVNNVYTHTTGILDLKGNSLTNSPTLASTSNFTAGSIITSVSGGSITITDVNILARMNFNGTNFGDATNGVNITCASNDSYFNGGIFYGTVNFTKTGTGINDCNGGCTFYGPCTWNTNPGSDRWRLGCVNPDIFYNATFNHLATGAGLNFHVARSMGNQFYGNTNIYSAASGGFYVGRINNSTNGSANFHGPVSVTVTATGNAYFGESSATISNTSTFESTLQLNSTASSTGDIYIGWNILGSAITFASPNGQLIDGTIAGATNVYLYNVTQNSNLACKTTNTAASNSTIYLGNTNAPCIWNGNVTFTAPNINLTNSTYNGSSNSFLANGTANQTCTGGNTFAAGTATSFSNTGTGYWELANTTADNYNGDISYYRGSGAGALSPAYATNCNYAGNITITTGSDSVDFAAGGGGVAFTGTSSTAFTNSGTKGTSMKNITMNKTGGASFTLNNSVGVPANGGLTFTSGLLNTSASAYLFLMDETCTAPSLTDASTSYINGPMRYDMSVSASTKILNFPVGSGADCRPFVLTTRHASATSYSYLGQAVGSPASMLVDGTGNSWIRPATVDTVSGVRYWTIDRTVTSTSVSASNTNLSYSAGTYPLVQFYFGTNDFVYQGTNLTIVKNTSAAPTTWIDIGASCALGSFATPQSGNITSTTSGTPFNSFSTFALGSKNAGWNSLPIELLSFSAIPNGEKVNVKWETSTETNNKYFTIERSGDGTNFTEITTVNSKAFNGNSKIALNYQTTDTNPLNSTSYYRLKQTDYNGKYKYFNMVSVDLEASKNITFSIYPNPNLGEFTVDFSGIENNHEVQIILQDELGKEVYSNSIYSNSINSNKVQIIPSSRIAKGKYFCSFIFEDIKRTIVVIVN